MLSTSNIPILTSEPARRPTATLTNLYCTNTSISTSSPERARRPLERSSDGIRHIDHLFLYSLPKSRSPRSESSLLHSKAFDSIDTKLNASIKDSEKVICLSKSQTTPALLSPHKDIASHKLLRLLSPALPHSITYDDFACSPNEVGFSRPVVGSERLGLVETKTSKRGLAARSPYPFGSGHEAYSTSSETLTEPSFVSNTIKSQTACEDVQTAIRRGGDPRYVYNAEPLEYWLGRFITSLDRMRSNELLLRTEPDRRSNKMHSYGSRSSLDLDQAEMRMKGAALKILRSFCKTEAAISSFDQFEHSLCGKARERPVSSSIRSHDNGIGLSAETRNCAPRDVPAAYSARSRLRKISDTLPSSIFRKPAVTQHRVEESFNLANAEGEDTIGIVSDSYDVSNNVKDRHRVGTGRLPEQIVCSRSSYANTEGRNAFTTLRNRKSGQDKPSQASIYAQHDLIVRQLTETSTIPQRREIPKLRPTSGDYVPDRFTETWRNADADEYGNSTALRREPENDLYQNLKIDHPTSGPARRFRKSESMKKLVDAGIREIRKISHRASNISGDDGMSNA